MTEDAVDTGFETGGTVEDVTVDEGVAALQGELGGVEPAGSGVGEAVGGVRDELSLGPGFRFDEDYVKRSLEELLLAMVALDDGTHGKHLMDELALEFDTQLSPGTVYPALHALDDDGLVEQRELVRTKEYDLTDHETTRERLRRTMRQHMALALFMRRTLAAF